MCYCRVYNGDVIMVYYFRYTKDLEVTARTQEAKYQDEMAAIINFHKPLGIKYKYTVKMFQTNSKFIFSAAMPIH